MSRGYGARQRALLALLAKVEECYPGGWVEYVNLTDGPTRSAVNSARRAIRRLLAEYPRVVEYDKEVYVAYRCYHPYRVRLVNPARSPAAAVTQRTVRIRRTRADPD